MSIYALNHPLIADKLTRMRHKDTSSPDFRQLLKEITLLMGYEVTRDFATVTTMVETPICMGSFPELQNRFVTIVPILRAGLGMVDGLLELMPFANVGHIGISRDESTHQPAEYYFKMPATIGESTVIVTDPMLATGGSAVYAISVLKEHGCSDVRLMSLVAAPEGVNAMQTAHPDVDIYVAAIDERLNDNAYIVPGLGDAGDRIFGTK